MKKNKDGHRKKFVPLFLCHTKPLRPDQGSQYDCLWIPGPQLNEIDLLLDDQMEPALYCSQFARAQKLSQYVRRRVKFRSLNISGNEEDWSQSLKVILSNKASLRRLRISDYNTKTTGWLKKLLPKLPHLERLFCDPKHELNHTFRTLNVTLSRNRMLKSITSGTAWRQEHSVYFTSAQRSLRNLETAALDSFSSLPKLNPLTHFPRLCSLYLEAKWGTQEQFSLCLRIFPRLPSLIKVRISILQSPLGIDEILWSLFSLPQLEILDCDIYQQGWIQGFHNALITHPNPLPRLHHLVLRYSSFGDNVLDWTCPEDQEACSEGVGREFRYPSFCSPMPYYATPRLS